MFEHTLSQTRPQQSQDFSKETLLGQSTISDRIGTTADDHQLAEWRRTLVS
jgi:hypothetical protein